MYHSIDKATVKSDTLGMVIPPDTFLMQLQCLRDNGLYVMPLFGLVETIVRRRELPEGAIAITFDDGYQGVLTHALPMLKEFVFPATLFANISFIERRLPVGPYGSNWPTLTWDDLRTLHREGMSIGSHSLAHERLNGMSEKRIAEEVTLSKELIERRIQSAVDLFSYPHGAFDERVVRILKDSGFSSACSSIEGANDLETDLFVLRRTEITTLDDTPAKFERKLLGCYDWLRFVRAVR